jgi:hypothetical protein
MPMAERRAGRGRSTPGIALVPKTPTLVWKGADYPKISSGKYQVRGVSYQGPEWVRAYQRWSLRIEFALVTEPGRASAFFNFGTNPEKVHIGRQSRYWKAWVQANGELPTKGQEMTPEVFLEGQFFWVTIDDAVLNSDRAKKSDAEVYSRITEFHSVERPQS